MKQDYTHISIVLDRSGSMESIRDDVIGGFNHFVRTQQETAGLATLSLIQFDSHNPYEILHSFQLVQAVPLLTRATYAPRASTPLLDAMGRCIKELEAQLVSMKAQDQPEHVLVVIITDGMENASRHFSAERVRAMIAEKQELAGWKFVYLSADIDAVEQAVHDYGVAGGHAMAFDKTAQGSANAFQSVAHNVNRMRTRQATDLHFSEEDRNVQHAEQKRRNR